MTSTDSHTAPSSNSYSPGTEINSVYPEEGGEHEKEEEEPDVKMSTYAGVCIDDGTGRGAFFLGNDGKRSRIVPEGYAPEILCNGKRKYYFRGTCVRCKNPTPQIALSRNVTEIFCFNMCEACLLATTPDISRTAHNGNAVYTANEDMPLTCYSDFGKSLTNPHRDEHIIARCVEAQEAVLHYAKLRRNKVRYKPCKVEAYKNQVSEGQYISWGFGDKCFDEYFGEVAPVQTRPKPTSSKPGTAAGGLSTVGDMQADHFVCPRILAIDPIEVFRNELEPHGLGIKFFADGSIYVGEFTHGKFNTEDRGVLSRPSGLNYEGTWMSGLKHGSGMQIYADHSVYTGEFANGFEHGEGRIQYADGAHFHGRFRFGRRDGPGQMTVGQEAVRRHYRDKENLLKEGMPVAQEADDVRSDIEEDRLNPPSLLDAATDAVALAMTKTRSAVSGPKIQARLSEFLKHKLVQTFFAHLANSGRPSAAAFEEIMSQRAFTMHKELAISYIRMKYDDLDILLFFISANTQLESLLLRANHLTAPSIGLLGKQLTAAPRLWPKLSSINLSFNAIDSATMQILVVGFNHMTSLRILDLSGCSIRSNTAHILALHLAHDKYIKDVNLSFNYLGSMGGMSMATTIEQNRSITSLNLRHNDMGYSGGAAIAEALRKNYMMQILCLVDNGIGEEVMATVSGRLRCTLKGVIDSVRASETDVPAFYVEGRFADWKPRVSNLMLHPDDHHDYEKLGVVEVALAAVAKARTDAAIEAEEAANAAAEADLEAAEELAWAAEEESRQHPQQRSRRPSEQSQQVLSENSES